MPSIERELIDSVWYKQTQKDRTNDIINLFRMSYCNNSVVVRGSDNIVNVRSNEVVVSMLRLTDVSVYIWLL